jgi:hypothetical protein
VDLKKGIGQGSHLPNCVHLTAADAERKLQPSLKEIHPASLVALIVTSRNASSDGRM